MIDIIVFSLISLLGYFIYWAYITGTFFNICRHDYGTWSEDEEDQHYDIRFCKKCNKRQRRNINY